LSSDTIMPKGGKPCNAGKGGGKKKRGDWEL
jgi:hypothetical protein